MATINNGESGSSVRTKLNDIINKVEGVTSINNDIDVTGTVTADGLTVAGNVSVDGGTIKLDGNYPVGTGNVALGDTALDALTSGIQNTAIGSGSLSANTSGTNNTGVGRVTLTVNTTGSNNVALGNASLYDNTTGTSNTALGTSALENNTTASNNTAVGYQAGFSNTTGAELVAVGYVAGYSNTTGPYNTFLGRAAGYANTTGASNVAVGYNALDNNTTGSNNTAVGLQALEASTTASDNTAVGYQAGYAQTTATRNVLVGRNAGDDITTGGENVMIGYFAGSNVTTGQRNVIIGRGGAASGQSVDSSNNTLVGPGAGSAITTGGENTVLGAYNGNQGGLDIRTSDNYIVLSDGDGNPRGIFDASGNFLVGTTSSSGARITLESGVNQNAINMTAPTFNYNVATFHNKGTSGDNALLEFATEASFTTRGSITYNRAGGLVVYNTTSDYRAKDIAGSIEDASSTVLNLKPYMGTMKGATAERPMFVAHETQEVAPYAVTGEKDAVDQDGNPKYQQMDHSALVPLLTAALQEALTEIADLKARITALEAK